MLFKIVQWHTQPNSVDGEPLPLPGSRVKVLNANFIVGNFAQYGKGISRRMEFELARLWIGLDVEALRSRLFRVQVNSISPNAIAASFLFKSSSAAVEFASVFAAVELQILKAAPAERIGSRLNIPAD